MPSRRRRHAVPRHTAAAAAARGVGESLLQRASWPAGNRSDGARPGRALRRADVGQPHRRNPCVPPPPDPPVHPGVLQPPARARAGITSTRSIARSRRSSRRGPSRLCASASSPGCCSPRSTRTLSSRRITSSGSGSSRTSSSITGTASAGIRYWEVANEPDIGEDGRVPLSLQARKLRALLPPHGGRHPARRSASPRRRPGSGLGAVTHSAGPAGRLREREAAAALRLLAHLQQQSRPDPANHSTTPRACSKSTPG